MECGSLKVHLANGIVNNVRYNDSTTIQHIIEVILAQFGEGAVASGYYAMRLTHQPFGDKILASESFWLHRDFNMRQVTDRYLSQHPRNEWKFELRVRHLVENVQDMCRTETATFHYLYDQTRTDYLSQVAWKTSAEDALELGCIEIRRFFKDMPSAALDRRSNLDFLQNEIGLAKFFPETLLAQTKQKVLRKTIQQYFKRYANCTETECMFKFLNKLNQIARYDIEIFKASLGTGWSVPLEIVVGPDMGIGYITDNRSGPTKLANFIEIVDIQTHLLDFGCSQKALVQIRVSGTPQPLIITCPNLRIAESLATLLDGYQMLLTQQQSVWSRKDLADFSSISRQLESECVPVSDKWMSTGSNTLSTKPNPDIPMTSSIAQSSQNDIAFDPDYAAPIGQDYIVDRHAINIEDLLGEGHFGDVYRGNYEKPSGGVIPVAVKVCKLESEEVQAENFLEEALIMQQFQHPHIIKLVGVCVESPIWIAMEFAPFGELRSYLTEKRNLLDLPVLLLYCCQLSSALSYLDSRNFVHRDIAARNVLVSNAKCVKLSDFGLSRLIENESFYTASRGKLPIKWMAPESINFRRFTAASDVWMFGVCLWEVLMRGVKPWQGVRNHEIIQLLEKGDRLAMPPLAFCPPQLYTLLSHMWTYEPEYRPKMAHVKEILEETLDREREDRAAHREAAVLCRQNSTGPKYDGRRATQSPPALTECGLRAYPPAVSSTTVFSTEIPSVEIVPPPLVSKAQPTKPLPSSRHVSFSHGLADDVIVKQSLNQCSIDYSNRNVDKNTLLETLNKQKMQSIEDDKWLEEEERNLLPQPPTNATKEREKEKDDSELPQGMVFDRNGDCVYGAVLRVVQSITDLSTRLRSLTDDEFVETIKNVTMQLKSLLVESGNLLKKLTSSSRIEVQMVEKLLGADMHKLADSMRLVLHYRQTTLNQEYRRQVLSCAHILAVDCKHFLEAADSARLKSAIAKIKPFSIQINAANQLPSTLLQG